MLAAAEHENLIETLELLSMPGLLDSLERSVKQMDAGKTYSMEDVFGDSWCMKSDSPKKP